jgi:DNA primase large subunit
MDLNFCAKYPFTSDAKEHISKKGIVLTSDIVERAEARLKSALLRGEIPRLGSTLESELTASIASYAASRMMLSAMKNRFLAGRHAVAEAKRASSYLNSDTDANVAHVASQLGLRFVGSGVPVSDFVHFMPRSYDYKLVNRKLKNGIVSLSRHERVRLTEEAVRKSLESSLPVGIEVPANIREAAERIKAQLPKEEVADIAIERGNFPPCIKKLLEDLGMGENLGHTSRWVPAAYLLKAKVPKEDVIRAFATAPDFDFETTRYQVEYVAKKGYSVPTCASMDSYGICVANCHVGSPLRYRKPRAETEEKKE